MFKKKSLLCIAALILFGCTALSACSFSQTDASTPQEIITQAYGNKQFKISFSSDGLTKPIADITYSAQSMPVLPTPERMGYIFEGWYYDKAYTMPYEDGSLYLVMDNVTLYPKWTKEEMVMSGTYDIEFSAVVLEDTLKKGTLTDAYGGYKDITEDISIKGTYIEKTDGDILLKIQYDCGFTVPYGYSSVYEVRVSSRMGSSVYIQNTIASDVETEKTVFLNLNGFDISQPVYLDITATDWESDGLSVDERALTTSRYTVEFSITKFIGFSRSFIDPDVPLEDGYYLAKTYYRQENNTATMMDSYNPVYSYIIVKDGKYSLVKPYTSYAGLIVNQAKPYTQNYYARAMFHSPVALYYGITRPDGLGAEKAEAEYMPEFYSGEYYGDFSMEFHADTGRHYYIFDLGNSVKKEFMLMGATSGFMEIMGAMGYMNLIMYVDYDHIIKVADIDYQALSGTAYEYASKLQYYPGSVTDLNERDLTYDATNEYGVSADLFAYYFSCGSLSDPVSARTMYSHRVTITPTPSTNAVQVKDARYKIAKFNVVNEIYGYDGEAQLYGDSMSVNYFDGYGMRQFVSVKTGKSFRQGESVRIEEIFREKVNPFIDYSAVNAEAFLIKNGDVDFSARQDIQREFTFEKDIAVVFTWKEDGAERISIVSLVHYADPSIKIINTPENTYDPLKIYDYNETVYYPIVQYEWMGTVGSFIDNYFDSDDNEMGVNPMKVAAFNVRDGIKRLTHIGKESLSRQITEQTILVYELNNPYGEKYLYYITLSVGEEPIYTISEDGEGIISGTIKYDGDGERVPISESKSVYLKDGDFTEDLVHSYQLDFGHDVIGLSLVSYRIGMEEGSVEAELSSNADLNRIAEEIYSVVKDSGYAVINLRYGNGEDSFIVSYVYHVNLSGKTTTKVLDYSTIFSNYTYSVIPPSLYGIDGTNLGDASLTIQRYNGEKLVPSWNLSQYVTISNGTVKNIIFKQPGNYRLIYAVSASNTAFDDGVLTRLSFSQDVEVKDGYGEVYVNYITDADHPFSDGLLSKRVTYQLTENIILLSKNAFVYSKDMLYGWRIKKEGSFRSLNYENGKLISDFIGSFHSQDITLYATWDAGIDVIVDMNTQLTGQNNIVKHLYANGGSYQLKCSSFEVENVPKGYVFVGFTGGCFGDTIVAPEATRNIYEGCTIQAVFKKQYKVTYIINQTLSNSYFVNDTVLDGDLIPEKPDIVCKDENIKFKYWKNLSTGEYFDIQSTPVTENIVLVAVFEDAEGNEIW